MYSSLCLAGHCVQARLIYALSISFYAINSFCWYLAFVGNLVLTRCTVYL